MSARTTKEKNQLEKEYKLSIYKIFRKKVAVRRITKTKINIKMRLIVKKKKKNGSQNNKG